MLPRTRHEVLPLLLLIIYLLAAGCAPDLHPFLYMYGQGAAAETVVSVELDFENGGGLADVTLVKEDDWYQGQAVSYTDGAVWLTPNPLNADPKVNGSVGNIGRMVYGEAFVLDSNTSIATSFRFKIVTNATDSGSGMAFFLSTSQKAPPYSQGGALGLTTYQNTSNTSLTVLTPPYPFFAVEFDTSRSLLFHDPSNSHVGIDIDSLISSNVTDTDDTSAALYLYSNHTFTAWIDYDARTHLIRVWMTNDSDPASRPASTLLHYAYDISTLFNASVYAGFTSANRFAYGNLEGAAIYAWNLTITRPSSAQQQLHLALLIGLPLVIILILAAAAVAFFVYQKRRRRQTQLGAHLGSLRRLTFSGSNSIPQRYLYRDIRRAAGRFSEANKIGEGGCSIVYLAKLPGGSLYAVKRLKDSLKKEQEFQSEIEIISALRHRNLLSLEGWCYEKGEALLLYKYMSKGSLDQYVHGKKRGTLTSEMKLKILAGVASGLEYLHSGLGCCVLHRDVKAENVLLTENYEALLCDFGLARLITHNQAITLTAVGTPGYVAPELVYTGRGTDKADVYSYGVLALVVACGRRPMDPSLSSQEMRLIDWLWQLHHDDKLLQAFDPSIEPSQEWICVLHLALTCCNPDPDARPSMRHVLQVLEEKTVLPLPVSAPTYPVASNWRLNQSVISISDSQTSLQPGHSSDTGH